MKITIEHENYVFHYDHSYQAYVFECAIYNDIEKRYGIDELKAFVSHVCACYLKDSNPTPLGALTDFMAEHWKEIKDLSRYDILDKFYEQLD